MNVGTGLSAIVELQRQLVIGFMGYSKVVAIRVVDNRVGGGVKA